MKHILYLIVILSLISCVTKKSDSDLNAGLNDPKQMGIWEVKAQVRDIKTDKSQNVSLDFYVRWPDLARVDVSGPLNASLATLIIKGADIQYASYRQKAFYEGPSSDKAMKAIFKLNLDPKIIFNVCYDRTTNMNGWSCKSDEKNLPKNCTHNNGTKIVWFEREGFKKKVVIYNNEYEVTLVYNNFTTKVLNTDDLKKTPFQIEIPSGFTKYKVL